MLRTLVASACVTLLFVSSVAWLPAIGPAPKVNEAAARDVVLGRLLAYSVESGQSWAVFTSGPQIVLDRISVDRSPYLQVPALPRLRMSGDWHQISNSASTVDAGFIRTPDTSVLFGEVADERIAHVEIEGVSGRFKVGAPGFIIGGLAPMEGAFSLRWLDAGGQVVHQSQAFIAE
jgi:hypothetical protein